MNEFTFLSLVLFILALALLAVFAGRLWYRITGPRTPDAQSLPDGAVGLAASGVGAPLHGELVGSFLAIGIGTFGAERLLAWLTLMERSGLRAAVAGALLVENDAQVRERFRHRLPACFAASIGYGFVEAFGGGLANRSVQWALARIEEWGVAIRQAALDLVDRLYRQNASRAPATVLVFQSLGGQAALGLPVLQVLQERFDRSVQVIVCTALPRHEPLRERWADLKARYERYGCAGWILIDNLGPDPVSADYGLVALVVGLVDAALHADHPVQPNNAVALALAKRPGAVLIFQLVATGVVAYPAAIRGTRPARLYVYKRPLVVEIQRALRRLATGEGVWSAELPTGEPGASTFDIVITSVDNADRLAVQDDVVAGLKLRTGDLAVPSDTDGAAAVPFGQPNYELLFASIPALLDPAAPFCPVVAIRLTAVRDGPRLVGEIVKAPAARQVPPAPRLPAPPRPSSRTERPIPRHGGATRRRVTDHVPPAPPPGNGPAPRAAEHIPA